MQKIKMLIMLIAVFVIFYEQQKTAPNIYIIIVCFAIFMFGMMRLSLKTPSKNQNKENDN